jgi:hypothetical protein
VDLGRGTALGRLVSGVGRMPGLAVEGDHAVLVVRQLVVQVDAAGV